MNGLEQVKALENGKGVQYLLDCACKIFNNPIYIVDAYYNLIAASDGPEDLYDWNELIKTGTYSLRVREIMAKEGMFDTIANSKKLIHLEKKEHWKGSYMTGHIVNRDKIWVAAITMYDSYTPFDTQIMSAFEILIDKVSAEIQDYEYFNKLPIIFFEDTVNKLLDRTAENTLIQHSQAQIIKHELEKYLYVAVVSVPRNNILENVHRNRLAYFCSLLKTRYKSYRYAVYADKIVILMSSKLKNYNEEPLLGLDYDLFELNDLYAGISNSFEIIYEFSHYYDQAFSALETGMNSGSGQRVFLFDNT